MNFQKNGNFDRSYMKIMYWGIRYLWKSVVCSVIIKEQICLTWQTRKRYSLLFSLMYYILTSVSLPFPLFFHTALFQRSSYSRLLMTFVYIENPKDFLVSISNFPKGCLCSLRNMTILSGVFPIRNMLNSHQKPFNNSCVIILLRILMNFCTETPVLFSGLCVCEDYSI